MESWSFSNDVYFDYHIFSAVFFSCFFKGEICSGVDKTEPIGGKVFGDEWYVSTTAFSFDRYDDDEWLNSSSPRYD